MIIDKSIVKSRFSKSLDSYDKAALVQQQIAKELVTLIDKTVPNFRPKSILELGCGTGTLTEILAEQYRIGHPHLTLNDIVPEAQTAVRQRLGSATPFWFLPGDAEHLPWPKEQQLIASNCSIQWWDHPLHFFSKALAHTQKGGIVAASIFAKGHFKELQSILPQSLYYPTPEELRQALLPLGFTNIEVKSSSHQLQFPNLLRLLQHIKATGANAFTQKVEGTWSPARVKQLEHTLREREQCPPNTPLTLTYQPLIIIAQV